MQRRRATASAGSVVWRGPLSRLLYTGKDLWARLAAAFLIAVILASAGDFEAAWLWQSGHCAPKSTPLVATGDNWFSCARDSTYSCDCWAGGLMAMTEVEKSSRSNMERTFYTKLGPTPAFPPSPAETGQVKPVQR